MVNWNKTTQIKVYGIILFTVPRCIYKSFVNVHKCQIKKILFTAFIVLHGLALFSQNSFQFTNFNADCNTDFWTITVDGYIQQWSLSGGVISGGDTILSGGGQSLSYCGNSNSPTFFTDNWNPGEIGINYYDSDSGWINIPTVNHVQDNGGHLNDQYYTAVGGVIQYVNYWDGTNLLVIDSLPGEFFAGIFDIAVDTLGHAWVFTASSPGSTIDSLKVYDQSGKINSYSFQYDILGYGSFFLNNTLYIGTIQDSIFPVLISGNVAQPGIGIPFSSNNFTDMASCQRKGTPNSVADYPNRKIKLFPNPTTGYLEFSIDTQPSNILVYNSMGQLIEIKFDGHILDLTGQPSGTYYVKIITDGWPFYYTVMKY